MKLNSNIELRVVFHQKACESWHRNWAITGRPDLVLYDGMCFAGAPLHRIARKLLSILSKS